MNILKIAFATISTLPPVWPHAALAVSQHKANELCPSGRLFQPKEESCPAEQTAPQVLGDGPDMTTHTCADRYCVYTDTQFWGGRGISFVTTAEAMDTVVMPGLRHHYRRELVANTAVDAFEEREIDGRGIGLVARRFLRKGELIISEPPALMVHLGMRTTVPEQTRLNMQRGAVDALPLATRLETLGLMGHWGGDAVEDRLDTNSFTVALEKPLDHHALFTQTSRLNHACRPNCFYNFNRQSLTKSVYTIQDIHPGQELTVSYIDPTTTYQERQRLIHFWGFNCSCSACMLPPRARERSDEAVRLIHQYTKELKDWSNRSRGTPEMGEALVDLYQKEGLCCHVADGYRLAAHAYSAVRDRYNALRMANNAMGYGLQTWMDMGARMRDILQLMVDPGAHWTWNQRS